MVLVSCGPDVVRVERTDGLALECQWVSAARDQVAYYTVARDGIFRSGGGALASQRATTFATSLDDSELKQFVQLLRATDFASRQSCASRDGDRTIMRVEHAGSWSEFTVFGADPTVDPLRLWCSQIALRQFKDIIDSQPVAGERRR